MNCNAVRPVLSSYVDDELVPAEMAKVREHLRTCEDCEIEARELARLKQMIGEVTIPDPSADFEERLLRAVNLAQAEEPKPLVLNFWHYAAVAAAVMVMTLGGLQWRRQQLATAPREDITFEVQRDQMYSVGSDATSGSMVVPVNYGTR
ncbi:MAG: anti-sigma factor family protein [Fimbriimonas sp.]